MLTPEVISEYTVRGGNKPLFLHTALYKREMVEKQESSRNMTQIKISKKKAVSRVSQLSLKIVTVKFK